MDGVGVKGDVIDVKSDSSQVLVAENTLFKIEDSLVIMLSWDVYIQQYTMVGGGGGGGGGWGGGGDELIRNGVKDLKIASLWVIHSRKFRGPCEHRGKK